MHVQRTTIVADDGIMEQLREIARQERVPLAHVIRQALELRVKQQRPRVTFIGRAASTEPPFDTSERAGDIIFQPRSWH
jgi:hypothetical protein